MKNAIYILGISICFFIPSCKKEECTDYKGYPPEIGKIILNRCATTGCHTDAAKEAAAGLSLESWTSLFNGSRYGNTAVIPYRPDYSFLTYFVNTYNDLGPIVPPSMPPNEVPLTRDEVIAIKNWISIGAPANNGLVKWSNYPHTKMFVVNQGCDNVYIIDAETGLVMRCINIGVSAGIESAHYIEISPDEKYFYVCFYTGTVFQKFRTSDGSLVGTTTLGAGQWSAFEITPDGKFAFVTNWDSDGKIAVVNLETMTLQITYQGMGLLIYPHGIGMNGNNLYVTTQPGNFLYKIDVTDINNPVFNQLPLPNGANTHEIHFNAEGTEYAVTSVGLNQVLFFNAATDALIATVPTGIAPEEPHYAGNYLFVTCPNDNITFAGKKGCVTIIDASTHAFVKNIYTGWNPHGVVPDEENGKVWILHRNIYSGGPAPHHSSSCTGRNGYMTAINLNTLELIPDLKPELAVDPYFGAVMGHHH